jgi:molybdopterin-guanine dinucleotide biosynthesis protein A
MGFNKALLEICDKPLIRILTDRIQLLTNQIFISSNDLSRYGFLEFPVIPDEFEGQGPLAGLHAAMLRSDRSLFLLIGCDLPNLNEGLLRCLVSLAEGFDAVIPCTNNGVIHPLCAVYRKTCLPVIDRNLRRGANTMVDLFLDLGLGVRWVVPGECRFQDSDLDNLNTPEDLQRFRARKTLEPSHDS